MSILPPPFSYVHHPSDLSELAARAWPVALRIALDTRGTVRVLHVRPGEDDGDDEVQTHFPSTRELLHAWGVLPDDASDEQVAAIGVEVVHVELKGADPARGIAADARWHDVDLLVLATHARPGLARLFEAAVAEPAARAAGVPTLFVPPDARPLVDAATGHVNLRRVLIAAGDAAEASLGAEGAARMALSLKTSGEVHFRMVHAGPAGSFPKVDVWPHASWAWERRLRPHEDVVGALLADAEEWEADLVVMATHGHDELSDFVFGSRAERVERQAPCPVLVLPMRRP